MSSPLPAPADCRVVRLNNTLFPTSELERSLCDYFGIAVDPAETDDPDELIDTLAGCDALAVVSTSLPTEVVRSLARCRLISRLGNGTDKIDVATATEMGIVVSNAPFFCAEEMTDHIVAMLLALARQLPRMQDHMRAGRFRQARTEATRLQRLSTSTLGLVGFGATGEMVARRAQAFGMCVIATRRNLQVPTPAAIALGVEMVDMETLLARSDYVSLQLPLNAESYHLFDEAMLRRMKPGSFLINTSRGALVDEEALARVLREGPLAGAALDTYEWLNVFTLEEQPLDHPLMELDNVLVTSHVSAHSVQSGEDVARTSVQNLASVLNGRWPAPENIVNAGVVPRQPLQTHDPALVTLPC